MPRELFASSRSPKSFRLLSVDFSASATVFHGSSVIDILPSSMVVSPATVRIPFFVWDSFHVQGLCHRLLLFLRLLCRGDGGAFLFFAHRYVQVEGQRNRAFSFQMIRVPCLFTILLCMESGQVFIFQRIVNYRVFNQRVAKLSYSI